MRFMCAINVMCMSVLYYAEETQLYQRNFGFDLYKYCNTHPILEIPPHVR